MLLEIDLLTLSMGVGLKLPPFINPLCGQMGRSCPDVSKKVSHLYVSPCENEKSQSRSGIAPSVKKWGSGRDPRVHNMRLRD